MHAQFRMRLAVALLSLGLGVGAPGVGAAPERPPRGLGLAEHFQAIASRNPQDPLHVALRYVVSRQVQALWQAHLLDPAQPAFSALATFERLIELGMPLPWVLTEVVFFYGDDELPDIVASAVFMYGQTIKDLVRDAIRAGAAERSVWRVRVYRALRAAGGDAADPAAVLAVRPLPGRELATPLTVAAARLIAEWSPVDWTLVGLAERSIDLRFLAPNDDPGGYASAQ